MVAFRGEDGRVGVLDAFCPHMGAHLGEGGFAVRDLNLQPLRPCRVDVQLQGVAFE